MYALIGGMCLTMPVYSQTAKNGPHAPPTTLEPGVLANDARTASGKPCLREPEPVAINPDTIECHAASSPLPVIPHVFDHSEPTQVEAVRKQGDLLLERLNRPDRCGKNAKVGVDQACSLLIYNLGGQWRSGPNKYNGPWVYIVKIYRVKFTENIRNSTILAVNNNGSDRRIKSGTGDEPWMLLADLRVRQECSLSKRSRVTNGQLCVHLANDVRYHPMLLIGRGEADKIFTRKAIMNHFEVPVQILQNLEKLLDMRCLRDKIDC